MRYVFCPKCGAKLTEIAIEDDGMVPYCTPCGRPWFDSFYSCVLVLTYNEYDEIALTRQPHLSDTYTTVTSGYISPGESAEECAIREVKEELGLDLETLEFAGTYWFGKKDMLMHGFIGFARKKAFQLSEEVASAEWVPALEAPKTMFPERPGNALHPIYRKFLAKRGISVSDACKSAKL